MKYRKAVGISALAGSAFAVSAAQAAVIQVTSDITTSTTWTANNTYRLGTQIYVRNGATLTIEPGTVIASNVGDGGALAITRGSKIIANGTADHPIIFTSKADTQTWTNGDPSTGVWREACNEWGNLTIMGRGYIGASKFAGNTKTPNANNVAPMEGLVAAFPGDPDVLFGGGNDDDDSGTLRYVSLRYGGRVVALNNELNGLSLGGIGRETDIDHLDIMNNVDDGIEIWGGTVNIKYFNIWNIGDDCFDVDEGWRGKAQFGLLVQGYSIDAAQGSGVGDNIFETDGAEDSDCQPVTTACIYNVTVIGQPAPGAGDHGTAWRDNARVQYRNCIFMDLGDRLVSFDNTDGDGGQGYGFNGTLSWPDTWTTSASQFSTVNAPPNPAAFYKAQQVPGKLAEITDSVMFRNLSPDAYTQANLRGVFDPSNNNVLTPGSATADEPIKQIVRGPAVVRGGLTMLPVTGLDPRPKGVAQTSVGSAPNDGFFTSAQYRGGFAPGENWVCGWTAAAAYGFIIPPPGGCVLPTACPADLDSNGTVDAADLAVLLGAWGGAAGDLDGNGSTDAADLAVLLGAWGPC
ncbi:MAG: hypothetical protein U0572_05840 [Phycisphaerales bacterium]